MATPFLIFTRFSILSEGNSFALRGKDYHRIAPFIPKPLWPTLHRFMAPSSIEQRRHFLFDDQRMRDRFWLFRNLTLPSLANQTEKDFQHFVLHSSELPDRWLRDLSALGHDFGFSMVPVAPSQSVPAVARSISISALASRTKETQRLVTARIDDDDALSRTFVEEVLGLVDTPLRSFLISRRFGQFLVLRKAARPLFKEAESVLGSQGLTLVEQSGAAPTTVFGLGSHSKAGRNSPVLYLPTPNSFLISTHVHNDSVRFSRPSVRSTATCSWTAEDLETEFGIDLAALETFGS